MKVLIACEESQRVCIEFRKLGHECFSCDVESSSGGRPEWHIKSNVLPIINGNCEIITENGDIRYINGNWDLIVAHPPCTYLSNVAAPHLFKGSKKGECKISNMDRYNKGLQAKEFFLKMLNADCGHICVENPTPMRIWGLPKHSCVIQPYEHGDPFQKRTLLWLKNLPYIVPTNITEKKEPTTVSSNWYNIGGKRRQKNRSKTFPGIAKAIATQFSKYIEESRL